MTITWHVKAYFFARRFWEFLAYALSRRTKRRIVVLTFDDDVTEETIAVAEHLNSWGIRATFFLTLNKTKPEIIKRIAAMTHELGGHSLGHSREERSSGYATATACFAELKKYDSSVMSWRFPWTSKDTDCIRNVKNAGFVLDSSVGTFYPVKKLRRLGALHEIPWLRLPRAWQMDVNENDYSLVKSHIIRMVSSRAGVFVLGFHTYHQYRHFSEFKDLLEKLKNLGVEFLTLRDAYGVLKNGTL